MQLVHDLKRVLRRLDPLGQRRLRASIVYVHLPKCGGSSVRDALMRHYPSPKSVFLVPAVASVRAARLAGRDVLNFRRDVLLFALERLREGFIAGHFAFSRTAWDEFHPKWRFITVLRDPVRRWFSHYFYNRFTEGHHDPIREELVDFVKTERAANLGRLFVRFLSGECEIGAAPMPSRIEAAINNLEKFDLVGVLEDLPQFCRAFRQTFGRRLAIDKLNGSPLAAACQHHLITADIRAQVEELCGPDLQVYQHALRMTRGLHVANRGNVP